MINKNRIVPIVKTDLLSLIGTILKIASVSYTVITSKDVEGNYDVTGSGAAGTKLADQPLKSVDFKSGVTSGTVYFVPAVDYAGIKVAGSAATIADGSATVIPDGATLYTAALSSGEVTITAITPVVA